MPEENSSGVRLPLDYVQILLGPKESTDIFSERAHFPNTLCLKNQKKAAKLYILRALRATFTINNGLVGKLPL